MDNTELFSVFDGLSTAALADACLRTGVPTRYVAGNLHFLFPRSRLAGRVLPVRHYGSVDVFFEAMRNASMGDVLVIDNDGRTDEGCIGDLTALEAKSWGISGIIVWGCHRDTRELVEIGLQIFSLGTCPAGPQRLDPREADALSNAAIGSIEVKRDDFAFADDDGVVFIKEDVLDRVLNAAKAISRTERKQASDVRSGKRLSEQLHFDDYLAKRNADPTYTFRAHLREIGGSIEE